MKTVLSEMTNMVKHQQLTISDLSKKLKVEVESNNATCAELESAKETVKSEKERSDVLAADADKFKSRIGGLEHVIEGRFE